LENDKNHDFVTYPDYLCEFGGQIEQGEQPIQAIIRELKEELGALVQENELVSLGALTEAMSGHTELVYVYFWHDALGTKNPTPCAIILFDDIITSGAHFKAVQEIIHKAFPNAPIIGLFVARNVKTAHDV
jgi:8-oxo-dGTP pyrophosphatase MutT (NUDIX family)